MSNKRLSKRS